MSHFKPYWGVIALCMVAYIAALSIRIYWTNCREELFLDESFTYSMIYKNSYLPKGIYDQWKTGREIKDLCVANSHPSVEGLGEDLKRLYFTTRANDHTNLFFVALRLFLNIIKINDFYDMRNYGIGFNCILFTLSFFLFTVIYYKINGSLSYTLPLILLLAFASNGSVATTLFIRMYQIQETLLLLLLTFPICLQNKYVWEGKIPFKDTLLFSICLSMLLLSGYYMLIFVFFLLTFMLFKYKNKFFIICSGAMSIVFCFIAYNGYFDFLSSSRTTEAFNNFFDSSMRNIKNCLYCVVDVLDTINGYYLLTVLIFALASFIAYKYYKSHKYNVVNTYFISGIISIILIYFLAPFKTYRYISPFIILFYIPFMFYIPRKKIIYIYTLIVLNIFTLINVFNYPPYKVVPINKSNLSSYIESHKDTKLLAYGNATWAYHMIIPTLPDDINFYIGKSIDSLRSTITPDSEYILLVPRGEKIDESLTSRVKDKMEANLFSVYMLDKQKSEE